MTQEPEPTRELDMSQLAQESPEESVAAEKDVVAGEPGWDAAETADTGDTVPPDSSQ